MKENQEIVFARTLEAVKKLAKEQGNFITEEQVKEAFEELSLEENQLALVFDYLRKHKIGIGEPVNLDEYLSLEEADYLDAYKKELEMLETVSEGEKEALLLSAMAGARDAQEKLIHVYLPQVMEISKLYSGQGVYLEDLIGEGNVALTIGVTMLGAQENAMQAEGVLIKMIMDAMEEMIEQTLKETDTNNKITGRINKVADKAEELAKELHRKVSVEELAKETGMSQKSIKDAMRISGFTIEGLE